MKKILLCVILSSVFISCNTKNDTQKNLDLIMVRDSLKIYEKLYEEAAYFSIDKNENAQKKFEPEAIANVMQKVIKDFASLKNSENSHPLLPLNTKINKLSVINYKWLILDYYGENNVGELLIEYNYQQGQQTTFKVIGSATY